MKRPRIDIQVEELDQILNESRQGPLSEPQYQKLKTAIHAMAEALLGRSRHNEKTRAVVNPPPPEPPTGEKSAEKPKAKGHGRNAASAYTGAAEVTASHPELQHGDLCPECLIGKVYAQKESPTLVRIVGQAPLTATTYRLEQLRCNACGEVYTAPEPEAAGSEKYAETAVAMIALLKYGSGVPFYRTASLERRLGVPLPAATQWEIVKEAADVLKAVLEELIRQAAQGHLFHNDDTGARILKMSRPEGDQRSGTFTSAVLSIVRMAGVEIHMALYFTGREHAGENLTKVLRERAAGLEPAIVMSDALSRNTPKWGPGVELLFANCLTHGRRNFVELVGNFPVECRYVLETLGDVYANDAVTKERNMPPEERLKYHQQHSQPLMDGLRKWMKEQFAERKVEPNSGLGKAIRYMQKHWEKLTLFLRIPGAPLDNNVCERALKLVVLHRKNALFYRTMNGARVGDLFMSLIHTCSLNGVNPFDYLVELLRHPQEIATRPQDWMPWNYRKNLASEDRAA